MFFDNDTFHVDEDGFRLELIPSRLRGETAQFEIQDGKGNVIVEESTRITARHIREIDKAGLTSLNVPVEYVCGHVTAEDVVDAETGEILLPVIRLSPKKCSKRSGSLALNRSTQSIQMTWIAVHLFPIRSTSIQARIV